MNTHAERRRARASTPRPHPGGAVRLHIERLVLHGVRPVESARIAGAVEAELASLAAQPGSRFAPTAAESLPAARITAGPTPEQTGRAVSRAVWTAITATSQGGTR